MTDTSRRRVLNNAFQVLKPPCLQRVRCFAVVAAVFFIRGILNDPWLLGRPWRQESWGPIAVATNWCQWERALGLGLWGLGLGLRGLGNGLLGGLGRLRRGVLTAFAPKALASAKLWQQCAGSHRIAASAAPLALAVGSGQVLLGHFSSIHVPLCIKAAVVIHTNGQLGASCIDTHAQQPLGRGLRLVMYRCVSFSIEKRRYSRMY